MVFGGVRRKTGIFMQFETDPARMFPRKEKGRPEPSLFNAPDVSPEHTFA